MQLNTKPKCDCYHIFRFSKKILIEKVSSKAIFFGNQKTNMYLNFLKYIYPSYFLHLMIVLYCIGFYLILYCYYSTYR